MSGTLGERIKAARKVKKLAVGQLAMRVGITEDALRKLESGNVRQPAFIVGIRIAMALGINPLYLALGDESYRRTFEARSAEDALQELERLLMKIGALGRLASNLEDQVRDALKRIARGS